MALPSSPPLSLTQILSELGRLSAGQSLSGAADERTLSGVASGPISFSDYLGKSAFTFTQVNPSGSVYTPGTRDALIIGLIYDSTNGFNVNLTDIKFGTASTSIQVDGSASGSQPKGCAFSLYTGPQASGTITPSSSTGNGVTVAVVMYKVIGYGGIHDVAGPNQTLTTVSGKAALRGGTSNFLLTSPTTGASLSTSGLASGISLG
jgi:hypothetical protein